MISMDPHCNGNYMPLQWKKNNQVHGNNVVEKWDKCLLIVVVGRDKVEIYLSQGFIFRQAASALNMMVTCGKSLFILFN